MKYYLLSYHVSIIYAFHVLYVYLHLDGYMCTIISLDIQTHGEDRYLNPQTSPEKAFRGSFNTSLPGMTWGFWMFKGFDHCMYLFRIHGSWKLCFLSDVYPVYGWLWTGTSSVKTRWLATAIWRFSSQERNRWQMFRGRRGECLQCFATRWAQLTYPKPNFLTFGLYIKWFPPPKNNFLFPGSLER